MPKFSRMAWVMVLAMANIVALLILDRFDTRFSLVTLFALLALVAYELEASARGPRAPF